jgi:S-adenosylmethionine decarboxylase
MKMPKLGSHWILDAYDCDPASIEDAAKFRTLLTSLPIAMKMTAVCEPQIHVSKTTLAGLVLIAESHISLHASLPHKHLHADVFSCGAFDPQVALGLLRSSFAFSRYTEERFDR